MLARTITTIAFGCAPETTTAGHTPEELDKRIVASTLGGAPAILVDNINNAMLRSDTLAAVLTERPVKLRPLGSSRTQTVDGVGLVLVTGNGLSISEDLVRRLLLIELDPLVENAESRQFDTDPVAEAKRRRGELLSDALTIWRWARQQGDGLRRGLPLGSFDTWARWCRDPLLALGCGDPIERLAAIKASDPQRAAVKEIFDTWWENHRDTEVRALDLAEPVRRALDPRDRGRQYLIRKVQSLAGTRLAGYALEARQDGPPSKPVTLYRLQKVA